MSGWRCDKKRLDEKTGLFTKLELYRYFKEDELAEVVSFVNEAFKPVPQGTKRPSVIALMQKLDGKVYRNKGGYMKEFPRSELARAEVLYPNEYLYENLFMKAILHRGKVYLVRIYKLALERDNRQQIKLEITHFDSNPTNRRGYKENLTKARNKISAMTEITNRFDKQFEHGEFLDHTPHSFTLRGLKRWITTQMKKTHKRQSETKPSSFEVDILEKIMEKR